MLILTNKNIRISQSAKIFDFLTDSGYRHCTATFDGRQVIVVADVKSENLCGDISKLPGVEKVIPVDEPYQLCSRRAKPSCTVIRVRDFCIGGGNFGLIGGPCTVESERQMIETAIQVKKAGATALRGGAFKPRTSPYAFQGLKEDGLKILAKARKETGLAIVTEAMSCEEVSLVADYADVVQIGTRNAQNYRLLEKCGEMRTPILLKRGFSCTLEEFLMSAEYILAGGNDQVILCERGIRTFETYQRYTLPIGAIPSLRLMTHLPLVVDPSHAAGRVEFVAPLTLAAVAVGVDGLLVEVHNSPQTALCDGRQSLTPNEFKKLVKTCNEIRTTLKYNKTKST
ncbi:MAG: 3-deoxy-7-phosphoheptulonate synthase [Planctomycetaceae bacterium]|jgi:3-deoxy-7-phosphoheptulonate synthase|nr:3-deoxy-7-phosphoheptulonate synthase [Planctomycetaceae bacterium]